MNYRAIIFDCYGTLYIYGEMKKSWDNWFNTFYDILIKLGFDKTKEEFRNEIDGFFSLPASSEEENLTLYENRIQKKLDSLNFSVSAEIIKTIADNTIEAWHREIVIDPRAKGILEILSHKYKIALLTNWDHPPHIYKMLKRDGIQRFFDEVIISGETGFEKPDPKIFQYALDRLNITNKEALFIGDSEEDYLGSKNAGLDFLLISRNIGSENSLALDYKKDNNALEKNWTLNYSEDIKTITSLEGLLE